MKVGFAHAQNWVLVKERKPYVPGYACVQGMRRN